MLHYVGGAWLKGWCVFMRYGYMLNRFFTMWKCQCSRATQLRGSKLQSRLCSLLQNHSCRGGLALVCRLLLPGKPSKSLVVCCAFRNMFQTNKKTSVKTKVAMPDFSPWQYSALSLQWIRTGGIPKGDAFLKFRLFVEGFSAEWREAFGSQPRWLQRKE